MTQDIGDFISGSRDLVGLGEADHREPAFGEARNEIFAELVDRGFRSFALESDRVAAFGVDDYVREGEGSLDAAMSEGFSHGFGDLDANRRLVAWMREYNEGRPPQLQAAFHGIDAPLEFTAESPRRYLEFGRDRLGLELDISSLTGEDERWSRTEAVMDPAESPGDTAEAERLRAIADDMLTELYARAPELIASTSRSAWWRTKTHLTSGLGLLRYHRQAAQRIDDSARWSRLSATRDALMAQNLLDIRDVEARRGPTLVFAHNVHLQRTLSRMSMAGMELTWHSAGAIMDSLLGERYVFIAAGSSRLPVDQPTLEGADVVLEISDGGAIKMRAGEFKDSAEDAQLSRDRSPVDQAPPAYAGAGSAILPDRLRPLTPWNQSKAMSILVRRCVARVRTT
ncbi:erythromycin esterase family protein [Glycomyces sp. L485]|uniref:erythromycin esterase family protein n=1 Tax=Glycomyces sp. L485 TaxID=2909235 RepID=UPI0024077FFC|nr:erythromycin esterase family protein [Glycomyces sp. L485]